MKTVLIVALVSALGSIAGGMTRLGDISVVEDKQTGVRDCAGGVASVASNKNVLTLKNCKKVSVAGNKNVLTLEGCKALEVPGNENTVKAGTVKSIDTMGNKNTVTYKPGPKKEKPSISNLGNGNKIAPE
jgi:hypothetical protein